MQIQILCVGRIKDGYLNEGIAEFSKRLKPYASVFVTELPEVKVPDGASKSSEMLVKVREGEKILSSVRSGVMSVVLDPLAQLISSEQLSALFGSAALGGRNL